MITLTHASQLVTGRGIVAKDGRRIQESDLDIIEDGAVVTDSQGKIYWVGKTSALPKKFSKLKKVNLKNNHAVTPGFVDCHTHLVFAGDRSSEFARRCAGVSYEQISTEGGGIQRTVESTRAATIDQLFKVGCQRVEASMRFGVRALEIKSGYGLSFESEIKILSVIQRLKKKYKKKCEIRSTFLGAHDFPKEISHDEYFQLVLKKLLPEIKKKKFADAVDIFVDEGFYSLSQAKTLCEAAQRLGLSFKIHADEFYNTHSSAFAADVGALSADHLLLIDEEGIKAIARSQTVGVLLPTTAFYLKKPYAPARRLIDAGACLALATDFNPGTSVTQNLPMVMTFAALYLNMSKAEILSAVTYGAAKALGLEKKFGAILPGYQSHPLVLPFKTFEEVYYRFGYSEL